MKNNFPNCLFFACLTLSPMLTAQQTDTTRQEEVFCKINLRDLPNDRADGP